MPTSQSNSRRDCFAQTAPGLEAIAARELKALGNRAFKETGGVGFRADSKKLYEANLWLRTATRVVVRMAAFRATAFHELERRAAKVAWEDFLPAKGKVSVRVTAHKSRLYHSDAVAERILSAISRVAPAAVDLHPQSDDADNVDDDDGGPQQLFIVRIVRDNCEISADSSGALLHRRGYRQEVAKAPLRETLAAAMLLSSGWTPDLPLLDPMCGSGTIPIEAALIAGDVAAGLNRNFAFMAWPGFDDALWNELINAARERASAADEKRLRAQHAHSGSGPPGTPWIHGADRDAGAVATSQRNAERAGVGAMVSFQEAAVSESIGRTETSNAWIITNPPYGVRVGDRRSLRNLYASLGNHIRRSSSRLGILAPDDDTTSHLGLPLRKRFSTRNGGIPVTFFLNDSVDGRDPLHD